jgi:asparagine synthase (glutamine-hydrolysing)
LRWDTGASRSSTSPPLGRQPMTDGGGRLQIAFNGEIYNYRELRTDLEARGHTFRTATDTEVILEAYRE